MSGVPDWQIEREPMVNELACLRAENKRLKGDLEVERALAAASTIKWQSQRDEARAAARQLYRTPSNRYCAELLLAHPWLEEEA